MRKRKSSTRQKFLAKRGLKKTPKGKEVAHKVSLWKGGSDSTKNLHLIKKSSHKKKTVKEARQRARKKK